MHQATIDPPYHQSILNAYLSCPEALRLTAIAGAKPAFRHYARVRGSAVHAAISKCLEIFRLNDERIVRELVDQAQAAKLSLSEIRQTVQRALGIRPVSADEVVKKMWAFSLDQWLVIERAIQHVQRGGPVSDTRALELICADFLAGVEHEAIAAEVA